MSRDLIELKVTISVTYSEEGYIGTTEQLAHNLNDILKLGFANGMFTQNSEMEIDGYEITGAETTHTYPKWEEYHGVL